MQKPHPPILLGGSGPRCSTACSPTRTSGRRTGRHPGGAQGADRRAARAGRPARAGPGLGVKPERELIERLAEAASTATSSTSRRTRTRTRPSASWTIREAGLMGRLDELDLSLKLSKEEEAERLAAGWKRLNALRLALGAKLPGYGLGPPVLRPVRGLGCVGQGRRDQAAGGAAHIRHVRVAQFAAPTPDESATTILWRFWPKLPGWGGMAVFDRTWYGRVLVERVDELRDSGGVAARLRRDRRAGADAGRGGDGADQVLPPPVGG